MNAEQKPEQKLIQVPRVAPPRSASVGPIVMVAVSQLVIRDEWNARHPRQLAADKVSQANAEGEQLWESIKVHGVHTPIDVVRVPGTGDTYDVVAGFRRAVISRLLWELEQKAGANKSTERRVPCIVRSYAAEHERRAANLLENVGRDNLYPCELARGLWSYQQAAPEAERTPTIIAAKFGVHPKVAANYLRIRREGSPALLEHWDTYPNVSVKLVLEVVTLPKGEQLPALLRKLAPAPTDRQPVALKVDAQTMRTAVATYRKREGHEGPLWRSAVLWLANMLGAGEIFAAPKPKPAAPTGPKPKAKANDGWRAHKARLMAKAKAKANDGWRARKARLMAKAKAKAKAPRKVGAK